MSKTVFGDQRRKVHFGSQVLSPATSSGSSGRWLIWLVIWIYPIPPQTHHGKMILVLNFKLVSTLWYPTSSTLLVDGVCVTKKMRLKLFDATARKNCRFDLQVFSHFAIYIIILKHIQVILKITK